MVYKIVDSYKEVYFHLLHLLFANKPLPEKSLIPILKIIKHFIFIFWVTGQAITSRSNCRDNLEE
jgi:hypothetical protein